MQNQSRIDTPSELPPAYEQALARRFGADAAADLVAAAPSYLGEAPPAPVRGAVVFAPGAGLGSRDYRILLSHLAQAGFDVFALRPLGSPEASADRYAEAAGELKSAAEHVARLRGTSCIALAGHSLGGAAAVLAAHDLPQAKAAIDLDGDFVGASVSARPMVPVLYITGDESRDSARTIKRRKKDWADVSARSRDPRRVVRPRLRHYDFLDAAALPRERIPDDRRAQFGPQGGGRAIATVAGEVARFLQSALSSCDRG